MAKKKAKKKIVKKSVVNKTTAKKKVKVMKKALPKTKASLAKSAKKVKAKISTPNNKSDSIRPIRDMIVVRPDMEAETTPGGLFIPSGAGDKPIRGRVVAAGKGVFSKKGRFKPTSVKEGDYVLYQKYGGQEIVLAGETFLIIRESDLLGFDAGK